MRLSIILGVLAAIAALILIGIARVREGFAAPAAAPDGLGIVQFLSKAEVAAFLAEDPDAYVANLSEADLVARKVPTREAYIEAIKYTGVDIDPLKREIIHQATRRIRDYLMANRTRVVDGVRFNKLVALPFKIAITDEFLAYESGLPHTRRDIIFLPLPMVQEGRDLTETLLHEQIHVYQRMYPAEVAAALTAAGYAKYELRKERQNRYEREKTAHAEDPDNNDPPKRRDLVRSNPDLDEWIWITPEKQPMLFVYRTDRPTGIQDTIQKDPRDEHPYERTAYAIAGAAGNRH